MNCEAPGQPTFEQLMRLGPLPQVCHVLGVDRDCI